MTERPTGTVTFLFTDIEGSTRLWQEHPDTMGEALSTHDRILRTAIEAHEGYVFSTAGDAFAAAFTRAGEAVAAALDAQRALDENAWGDAPVRVRMGLHTGEAEERGGDYFGPTLNRGARVMAAGHGGQVLVSAACARIVSENLPDAVELIDLGAHRLKDLSTAEHLFQLGGSDLRREFPPLRTLDAVPNNLPANVASFVGRGAEIDEVTALLAETRLVTITGVGGVGKTRLSLEVAAGLTDRFPDGVWFVDLSPIADTDLIAKQVAIALHIQEQLDRPMTSTVQESLADLTTLIVFDNCEHLVEAAASLIDTLLNTCPDVHVLATSREPLGVMGETSWALEPLPVPSRDDPIDAATGDALQLFVERAHQADRGFTLTEETLGPCVEICRRLDGVPLAIELAAARVSVLSPSQIAERLDHRLSLLTQGSRTAAPRQQTLRAAIDWSHELLDPEEQRLFRTLSVFRGGFTLEAVEAVWATVGGDAASAPPALELLGQLVDKSLVTTSDGPGGKRFGMLETIREYAWDSLQNAGETEPALHAHRAWFAGWAAKYGREIVTADQLTALDALEGEHENLRALLERGLAGGDVETAVGVAADIAHFWWLHSHFGESGAWFQRLLEVSDAASPRLRAKLLMGAGEFSMSISDHDEADRRLTAARAIARELGASRREGWAEAYMTTNELWRVDLEAAAAHAATALRLFDETGDLAGIAYVMFLQVGIEYGTLFAAGAVTPEAAETLLERLEPVHMGAMHLGDRNQIGHVLDLLGPLALDAGDVRQGAEYLGGAVEALDTLGNQICLAHAMDHVALVAAAIDAPADGVALLAGTEALRQHLGVRARRAEQAMYDLALERTRSALESTEFEAAWQRGSAMDRRASVDHARTIVDAAMALT